MKWNHDDKQCSNMTSPASNSNICDPSFGSNVTIIDKETQTSNISVNLMSSDNIQPEPAPKDTNSTCEDDNIKVFEFCELIKDPEDDTVSIVKETFIEETINSQEGVFSKPTHNRFKYCREVIQPYCKTHSKACPEYPSHKEIPFKKSLSNTSKESKEKISSSGNINMSPDANKATFENPSNSSIKKGKKRPCPPNQEELESVNAKRECRNDNNCQPRPTCPEYKDEVKLKGFLSSCLSTTVTMAKKASSACIETCEKTIGIREPKCGEDKPTYYVLKKPKSKENTRDKSTNEGTLDSGVVQSLKSGVKGIVDTVISKTKETVNLLTSNSCNDLPGPDRRPKNVENKVLLANILPNKLKHQDDVGTSSGSSTEIKNASEATKTSSFSKITSVLPNIFKRKEDKSETNSSSSLTKIKSSITNILKSQDDESNKSSSLSSISSIFRNPFKSREDHTEANKSSLTKLTSIFTNKFKREEEPDKENKSLTKIKSVISNSFANNQENATSVKDNKSMSEMVKPAVATIEKVASVMLATASTTVLKVKDVKEGMNVTNIINSRLEKSSPEDDPNKIHSKPPIKISHDREQHSNEPDEHKQSMFTMLKSKIFSMFADTTEDGEDDSDDEEENIADKIFNKYCEQ